MTIAHRIYREEELPESARALPHDTITLGWEDRSHGHARRRTDAGVEFATSLPRGTVLRSGDGFVLEDPALVVTVVERPEAVFVIEPRSGPEWALFAYYIGNRHQPLMIGERTILCPDVPGVEQLLQQHHIPHTRSAQPFTPVAGVSGHQH
jgi:urease accessory protein